MFLDYLFSVTLKEAEEECLSVNSRYVGTEHILLSLLKSNKIIKDIFEKYDVSYAKFKSKVEKYAPLHSSGDRFIPNYSTLLKEILVNYSNKNDVSNLAFDILNSSDSIASRILDGFNVDFATLLNDLNNLSDTEELKKYGIILNDVVDMKENIFGRDEEILSVIQTLVRKKKNNPLLVGEAGVGKTAIVEELARRINFGNVPDFLKNKKIIKLDMATLLAGCRYRGDFEEKLTNIINELIQKKNFILFIDEAHTILNAGGSEGAIGAGDILKPYLDRSLIKCICATTINEYNKFLKLDNALDRRFEKIYVNEISNCMLKKLLIGIREEYEKYYDIVISENNIDDIVKFSKDIKLKKFNPDKSVELLDSVCAYVKVKDSYNNFKYLENNAIKNKDYKKALMYGKSAILKSNSFGNLKISTEDIENVIKIKNNDISEEKFIGCIKSLNIVINNTKFINCFSNLYHKKKAKYLIYNGSNFINNNIYFNLSNYFNILKIDFSEFKDYQDYNRVVGCEYINDYLLKKLDTNMYKVVMIENFDFGCTKLKDYFFNMINKGYYYCFDGIERKSNDLIFLISGIKQIKCIGFNSENKSNYFNYDDIINLKEKEIVY